MFCRVIFSVEPVEETSQSSYMSLYCYGSKLASVVGNIGIILPSSSFLEIDYELPCLKFTEIANICGLPFSSRKRLKRLSASLYQSMVLTLLPSVLLYSSKCFASTLSSMESFSNSSHRLFFAVVITVFAPPCYPVKNV